MRGQCENVQEMKEVLRNADSCELLLLLQAPVSGGITPV